MALSSRRNALPHREQHYMKELKHSLDQACSDRDITMQMGGSIRIPLWDFEEGKGDIWTIDDVEREPQGEEAWIWLVHQDGYEMAEVRIHLPSDTITDATITENVGL